MSVETQLVLDLMTNFDTFAIGESVKPISLSAAHLARAFDMLLNDTPANDALMVLAACGERLIETIEARVAEVPNV